MHTCSSTKDKYRGPEEQEGQEGPEDLKDRKKDECPQSESQPTLAALGL